MNEPFTTQDRKLAFALALSGCNFLPCEEGGPATNTYTPQWLRGRKMIPMAGVEVEEIEKMAEICVEKRIPGIVDYHFVRDAIFERAIGAWDAMVKEMQDSHAVAEALTRETGKKHEAQPKIPDISETAVMQVMYLARCGQKEFDRAPFIKPAEIAIGTIIEEREPLPIHGARVSDHNSAPEPRKKYKVAGGYRRWTLGCATELREAVLKGLKHQ